MLSKLTFMSGRENKECPLRSKEKESTINLSESRSKPPSG